MTRVILKVEWQDAHGIAGPVRVIEGEPGELSLGIPYVPACACAAPKPVDPEARITTCERCGNEIERFLSLAEAKVVAAEYGVELEIA